MKRLPSATFFEKAGKNKAIYWSVFILLGIIMYLVMLDVVIPKKIDVSLHQIAKSDIQSPVDIIDQQATNTKKKEALANAPSSYVYDKNAALAQVEKAGDIFDVIKSVKKDIQSSKANKTNTSDMKKWVTVTKSKLTDTAKQEISDNTIQTLLSTSERERSIAQDITSTAIYEAMSKKIKWSDLQSIQDKESASLPTSVLSDPLKLAISDILHYAIVPNYVFDAKATKQNQQEAANAVEDVVIHQGEVIVKKGDLITQDIMRKLKLVGLLDNHINILPLIGLGLLVVFLIVLLLNEFRYLKNKIKAYRPVNLVVFGVIFTLMLLFLKLDTYFSLTHIKGITYILPIASGTLLVRMFFTERLAIVTALIYAIAGGLVFGGESSALLFDAPMGFYFLFTSLAGALVLWGRQSRPKILQAGVITAGINSITVLILMMLQSGAIHWTEASMNVGFAILSGFISSILTIGLVPIFEATFGILSTMKLIELSNPNHPLLRKILTEAPGTYHHSVMVANLAEMACEAIGANGLLARVAAYYHDIGKTKRPRFFIENQMNQDNPHDKISPQLSRTIILSHPYDGADMLREYRFPKEIIDIAEQHHGTTLLKYFYYKAKEISEQSMDESEFRYPGPKVQTKEAAVVELADSVEAAVRSMQKPTPNKIQILVHKIFNDKLEDGQFDECDLTMHEFKLVKASINETLNGIFHSRIEYPDEMMHKKVKHG